MTLTEELIKYCNEIISDEIISCKKHKWACMRFLRDLDRTGKFPYIFDEEKAEHYFKWMRLFKHSKGPLAGKKKDPVIYEKFVYGNIYGWVNKDTGYRRFRRSYEQVGRKNAKSQDKAIQSLYEISALGEQRAEAYVAATKKEQTRHVWGEASWLYKNSDLLKEKFVTKFEQELQQVAIIHKKSGSFFARLSKDDKKTGDGANPHFMVLDEYHLQETTEYYDLATSGMKTRVQPLLSIITTAGFELNNPCYAVEYDYISKILDPNNPIENDRYFAIVCEGEVDETGELIDDIRSDEIRLKSNPIIGNTDVGKESIEIDLHEALDKPEKMRDLKTKTFNIWINQRELGYMDMSKWAMCGVEKIPDLKGCNVIVGFDLSAVIDLTSESMEVMLPNKDIMIFSHSFMPEATFFRKRKDNKIHYALWEEQGWITVTPGAEVDYRFMVKYVMDFIKEHELVEKEFCFDRYMATLLMQELTDEGHAVVDIPQGIPTLGVPTKDFRAKVYNTAEANKNTNEQDKRIMHNFNSVLTWALGNAVTRQDHNGNIMLDKSKAKYSIDPAAALMNAHVRTMVYQPKDSVYKHRGVIFL